MASSKYTISDANRGIGVHGEQYFFTSKIALAMLVQRADLIDGGLSIKEATAEYGDPKDEDYRPKLSYSPVWNFSAWRTAQLDGSAIDCSSMSEKQFSVKVRSLREASGLSWGTIMVLTNRTEGQVRRAYTERTNVQSEGTRIGQGGRFLGDEEELYTGTSPSGEQYSATGPRLEVGETTAKRLS